MMAQSLEYRGNDATGIALIDMDGKHYVYKNNEPAWKFCTSKAYKGFLEEHLGAQTQIVLVHTRKATKGLPYKNPNNHPITAGAGVIIHNGMISNDDRMFDANKEKPAFKRSCETDSDAIRAILDNYGGVDAGVAKEMSKLEGVAAIAAFHPATPGKLLLMRDSNPLVLGATKNFLAFASDKRALHRSLKPWVQMHNLVLQVHAPDLSFLPFPQNTAWVIGPEGFEDHSYFAVNNFNRMGNTKYTKQFDYHERHARGGEVTVPPPPEKKPPTGSSSSVYTEDSLFPNFVICPNEKCNSYLELAEDDRKVATMAFLACPSCKGTLERALDATVKN